jgi:hypothetical protein
MRDADVRALEERIILYSLHISRHGRRLCHGDGSSAAGGSFIAPRMP